MPAPRVAVRRGVSAPPAEAYRALDGHLLNQLTRKHGAESESARARLLGINRATLFRWRTGRFTPNLGVAQRIAEQLGTTVDRLFPRQPA